MVETAEGQPLTLIGRHVVVRTYSAGVHIGELVSRDGTAVQLKSARRLWYWKGAFTLNEVANAGVKTGSKLSSPVELVELTEAIEIIPTTEDARKILTDFAAHDPR